MIHKFVEEKKNISFVKSDKGIVEMICPVCKGVVASAREYSLLPTELWCWGKPTHEDWKAYKKEKGLTNEDIANIVGMSVDSVKNQTAPSKDLPKWAVSMLFQWVNK